MIKCPKCNFEQPEDIYCAQCGVNMKNFVPPKKSLIVSIFMNQALVVGLLFVGIIVFVLYDYSSSKKPKAKIVATITKQTSEQIDVQEFENPSTYKPDIKPKTQSQAQGDVPQAPPQETLSQASETPRSTTKSTQGRSDRPTGEVSSSPTGPAAKSTTLQVSFYQIPRSLLTELQRETNSSPFNGDGFGGIVSKKRLAALRKNLEFKSISSNRYKLDGMPISIFKGQKSGESAKSIGLYFQINPLKNDPTGTQIEVKSWGSLKLQENDENLFTSEMTLNNQYVAMIAGFLPKDKVFGDEEKSIFDSDRALKIYNLESFWDGEIDLIMFVELPD
jgi:hypothetical protein